MVVNQIGGGGDGTRKPEARAASDDLDRRYVFHPFTALKEHEADGPLMVVSGQGCRLRDATGKSYLDAMAGLWCVNIGYGNLEMAESLAYRVDVVVLPKLLFGSERTGERAGRAAHLIVSDPDVESLFWQ